MSSGLRTAFVYTSRFQEFDYGPGHLLRNKRLGLTYDLISACELLSIPSTCSVEPEPATDDELLVFLKPDYLKVLQNDDHGARLGGGSGNGGPSSAVGIFAARHLTLDLV
ncbi:MAG: hypothetical protein HYY11_04980 [Candidatus Methylomirabilis oxyfera]|nr:hypothetical protein [Candidatus Methylomirabilis oxyfera]